ncbi:MAG: magnesium/cobalt transporter CorA [Candidatus Magnetomorum sp.]|nr:magnesium/cobalt transporter CorA [Candidatus Magnetomorum sp.]
MNESPASDTINFVSTKSGLPPGSLIYVGDDNALPTIISKIHYNIDRYLEDDTIDLTQKDELLRDPSVVTWMNVCGLKDINTIQKIGENLNIHPLTLEDILNTHQRSKVEIFDDYIYVVLKKITNISDTLQVEYDQLSIIIGQNYVVTFEENKDNSFHKIKARIEKGTGQIRKLGSDYLAYALIDSIVDHYFTLQESIDDYIEDLEDELLFSPSPDTLNSIHHLKREMIYLRKAIFSISELMSVILREESSLITTPVKLYFRDVLDHSLRLHESVDTYRELISGMLNIYLSVLSNKTNEIMRILTVFASIFIPLTFVAGIYGMNFDYMPELHWKWSYPTLWVLFVSIILMLCVFFKRKKWL